MRALIMIGIGIACTLAGGLAVAGFYGWRAHATAGPAGTPVRIESIARGTLVERVSAPGIVQPREKVSISARVAARIVELPYDEGDTVTKGDPGANPPVPASVLVRLDARDLEAQLRAAEARYAAQAAQITVAGARIAAQQAQIAASRVMLSDAERDLRRQSELLRSKDVSQATVDQAQAKVDQLRAQLESAERGVEADRANLSVMRHELDAADAEIARARDTLSYTTITSPIDGTVTKLNTRVGELAITGTMNNPGTVIMEVADLSRMLVNAKVDESAVATVKPGQKASVTSQAYPGEVFTGVVETVALAHTEDTDKSKYFKTEILLRTDGRRVFSGLTADVEIETVLHETVLTVPSQAIVGRPTDDLPVEVRDKPEVDKDKTFAFVVYRVIDGKAKATPVKVGPSDVTHTVIESGLSEGEPVIVGPFKVLATLAHDQAVKDEKLDQKDGDSTTKPAIAAGN